MASLRKITYMFNFIETTTNPLLLYPDCDEYYDIIDTFLSYKNDTFNNYIIYTNNKLNYPKIDIITKDIINHINYNHYNDNNKYRLFCTLVWLYLKKKPQVENLAVQLMNISL
jgi:hypothetical protein